MALTRLPLVVQDDNGNKQDGCSITVTVEPFGVVLVNLYSDRDGAVPLANPFTAADGGDAGFYADAGVYKIVATKSGFTRTWRDVSIAAPSEGTLGYAFMGNGTGVPSSYQAFSPTGTGATTRTWQSKAQDVINARDYGVMADGGTDDTVALQAAINAGVAQRKTVVLPGGDILMTGTLTPGLDSCIVGQGRSLTTIAANHASNTTFHVRNSGFKISDLTITHFVARTNTALTFDIDFDLASGSGNATIRDIFISQPGTSFKFDAIGGEIICDNIHIHHPVANGIDFDISNCLIGSILNSVSGHNDAARGFAHIVARNISGQLQILNSNFIGAGIGFYSAPGAGEDVVLVTCETTYFDSNPTFSVSVGPTGDGTFGRFLFANGWLSGSTGYANFSGNGSNISDVQILNSKLIVEKASGVVANFTGVANLGFSGNVLYNTSGTGAGAVTFDGVLGGDVSANTFLAAHPIGFFVVNATDNLQIHHHNFLAPLITTPISNSASGTNNRFRDNVGLNDSPVRNVASGGTGAATLTGLLQGNGTSAFTAITNSSTVGQVLRVTGAATYAWGALDLSDTDAITGDLPLGNLAQGAALTVLANATNGTADFAALAAASDHQVLRRSGTALAFGAVNLAQAAAVTGTLAVGNGGTGITSLGSGVATWLGTPTSANLLAAVTGETGTGALVFATGPALLGPATLTFAPGAAAGSGNQIGLGFTATRNATSGGGTDTFNVLDISFTDSGSISATQTAALSFTSTYSNANNTSAFNLGVKAYAQTSQNLTKYGAFYAGATLFGGTLGTYSAFYAQAPAAAGGTVTAKFTLNGEASAGPAFNSDGYALAVPVTKTGTSSTVADTEPSVIFNASGTHTVTLPSASGANTGKILHFKSRAAQAVNSASSNVKPIDTDTAGTAILTATAGKWAMLQSDGTNWVIMASN
jgi:hypothetical protein